MTDSSGVFSPVDKAIVFYWYHLGFIPSQCSKIYTFFYWNHKHSEPSVGTASTRPKKMIMLEKRYSQISVIRTSIIRNYWVIRRRRTVPTFFSIIHCNKTTNYSNFDYPKKSIFRSDSSVPIKEIAIKLPFKIRSPNVTHGDHEFGRV